MIKTMMDRLIMKQHYLLSTAAMITFSQLFGGLISLFYEKILHESSDTDAMNFVRNLSYVGLGTGLSTVFSFSYNIIAGRVLGPSEYGGFMLVQSIAMFLYIPMLLGLNTAMIKYCAENRDLYQQRRIISTTYGVVISLTIVTLLLYGLFSYQIADLFSVSPEIIAISVLFALLFVYYTLATSGLRGLHQMKNYAIFQPVYGAMLLLVLLVFIYIQFNSFKAMVYAACFAYGITGSIIILILLRKHLAFIIDRSWLSTLWKYSSVAVIGGISFTFYTNIDRVMINYYMNVESVGIYGVYYYASFTVLILFSGIFTTVFFPTASKTHNKRALYRKLNKTVPYLLMLGMPVALIGEYIILLLFGEGYPIQFPLMLVFAVAAILVTGYEVYAWFFSSEGLEGAKLTVSGTLLIAITNIILNLVLIPWTGLYGAIGATAIAFALGLCYNFYWGKKFFNKNLSRQHQGE